VGYEIGVLHMDDSSRNMYICIAKSRIKLTNHLFGHCLPGKFDHSHHLLLDEANDPFWFLV
jgi:hypothetical protein